jgi:5-methylcytosine-specific restriction endonuclease McrA
MPAFRPCIRCGRLVAGRSYCRAHEPRTVSPSSRHGLRRSPATRRRVRERDGNRCVRCGSTRNFRVHHLLPVSRGGSNHEENLVTVCDDCHLAIHREAEACEVEEAGEILMLYGDL